MISSVTIGGITANLLAAANGATFTVGQAVYIAYVPTGTTADVVVTFNTVMTRCYLMWATFKPSTLTLVDSATVVGGASTPTDVTIADIATVNNGIILVFWLQQAATANTIIWTGSESITTDQALTAIDGTVFYAQQLSIQPTSATTTNDIVISSTGMRRNIVVLSFNVEGKFEDTVADTVSMAEPEVLNTLTYAPSLADDVTLIVGARHTPIQNITDTISEIIGTSDIIVSVLPVTVDEIVGVSGLVGVPVEAVATDSVRFDAYSFNYGWGRTLTDTTGFTENELSYYYVRGATASDSFGVGESVTPTARYVAVVAERNNIRSVLLVSLPTTVSDTVGVQYAVSVVGAVGLIDSLGLGDTLLNKATFGKTETDTIRLTDGLLRFFAGDVVDSINVTDLLARQRVLNPTLTETTGINDALTKHFIVRATVAETVQLTHTDVLRMLFRPTLADGVELAAAYVSPGNSVTTWAINTKNMATTEYTNYAFNSFAQMGHKYLGATSSGLYELNGDNDAGTNIIADIKSGLMQLGGSRFTSFKAAYLGMRGEGNFVLKLETGDGKTYNYAVIGKDMQSSKVHFGKGLRARYFSFELISTGQDFDLDTVEFIPLVVQRRV